MQRFEPGDLVKHSVNAEEGTYLRPVVWCVGSNKGEGFLVNVAGIEKMWLEAETVFVSRTPQTPEK